MEYIGNAMLLDEILESGRTFAFSPHPIHRGKVTGLPHKKLGTGDAAKGRCQTEQSVRGKGFGKLALIELGKPSLDVPAQWEPVMVCVQQAGWWLQMSA